MRQVLIHQILLKTDLANLKSDVDKLDIDKLKNVPTNLRNSKSKVDKLAVDKLVPAPVDLSKLSDAVRNGIVKKDAYNAKIKNIEDKILDITNLATNITLNGKINEVKKKISSIILTQSLLLLLLLLNIIANVSNLVKKTAHNIKVSKTGNKIATDHDDYKYITTQESTSKLSQAIININNQQYQQND